MMHKYIKKFLSDYTNISEYYSYLINKTKQPEYVGITNEWIIDNYYLIIEHKNYIMDNKKCLSKDLKNGDGIYEVLKRLIEKNEYNVDYKKITKEINNYQKKHNIFFSYEEISLIPIILVFIYVSKLCDISNELHKRLQSKDEISEVIKSIRNDENINIDLFLKSGIDLKENNYIFELNNQLKELGTKSNNFFKELNIFLEEKGISLKELLNDEYQERTDSNLLVSNIFNNLKSFIDLDIEDLYESLSKCEKYLMEDSIYNKMTKETKEMYRRRLIKLAKKAKLNEIKYVERLYDEADHENYHIGMQLFKPKNKKIVFDFYFITIFILSIVGSVILSKYFIKLRIVGFLILLIPIFQLLMQIINQIVLAFVRPKPLPKLDYSKKIDDESATMVVIPTIISDTQKVKEVFDKLETFYIFNKSDNLYFTLLGDVKNEDKKVCSYDEELSKFGKEYAAMLNKKYKKDLFYFVYRKRLWNERKIVI